MRHLLTIIFLISFILQSCSSRHACIERKDPFYKSYKNIICKNPMLFNAYSDYNELISDSLMNDVLFKIKNKEYSVKKGALAISLFGEIGTNWEFHDFPNSDEINKFEDITEFLDYRNKRNKQINFNFKNGNDSINSKTKQILMKDLNVGKSDYILLKKDQAKIDTILKYHHSLDNERIKYRLSKYLDNTYDWKMLYTSFQLEGILGPNFEFSDSIPPNSPSFNDLDSVRMYDKQMHEMFEEIMSNIKIQSTIIED